MYNVQCKCCELLWGPPACVYFVGRLVLFQVARPPLRGAVAVAGQAVHVAVAFGGPALHCRSLVCCHRLAALAAF